MHVCMLCTHVQALLTALMRQCHYDVLDYGLADQTCTWCQTPDLCVDCSRLACCVYTHRSADHKKVVWKIPHLSVGQKGMQVDRDCSRVGLLCVYVRTCIHTTTCHSYVLSVELSQLY